MQIPDYLHDLASKQSNAFVTLSAYYMLASYTSLLNYISTRRGKVPSTNNCSYLNHVAAENLQTSHHGDRLCISGPSYQILHII
jgi:hypothetical protein